MNNRNPLVSVIIPTCNRKNFIYTAILSIEMQQYDNIEIIIIDDSSKPQLDKSQLPKCRFSIKIIVNHEKLGGAISRNIGIKNSNGDYICFLDDDDEYLPNKINFLLHAFSNNKQADAIFGKIIKKSQPNRITPLNKVCNNKSKISSLSALKYLHTNSSLIKRSVFNNLMFHESLEKYQDTQIHSELIKRYNCYYFDTPVAIWNDNHGGIQITNMSSKENRIKSIINYQKYRNQMIILNCFNFHEKIKTKLSLINMYYKYHLLFQEMPSTRISKIDKFILNLLLLWKIKR
ncbi:glycosyltransferase family 2 protein [Providencia rettgeri]